MELTCRESPGALIVTLRGRLDANNSPECRQRLQEYAQAGGCRLILDLSGLEFVDSSGLGVLLTAHKLAGAKGGDVRLACPTPSVRRLLTLTRLDRIFACFESLDEANRSFVEHPDTHCPELADQGGHRSP